MLDEIKRKSKLGEIEASEHAVVQMVKRNIAGAEAQEAIASAQLIEDYPEAPYGPCCLIFGKTAQSRPLHLVVTYPYRALLRIITIYEPDPAVWADFTTRIPKP